jgi:hypothetical protein
MYRYGAVVFPAFCTSELTVFRSYRLGTAAAEARPMYDVTSRQLSPLATVPPPRPSSDRHNHEDTPWPPTNAAARSSRLSATQRLAFALKDTAALLLGRLTYLLRLLGYYSESSQRNTVFEYL